MKNRIIIFVSIALVTLCIYPSATTEAQMFEPGVHYDIGDTPEDVAIADLNGDSHLDLAAVNCRSETVSVLMGNGDGTFQGAVDYGTGDRPYSIAVADLNGDGIPDLITGNEGSDDVSVLLGNGDGTFGDMVNYAAGNSPHSVATCDLDGDGDNDIAVANRLSNSVSVLLGNGDGTFQPGAGQVFDERCRTIAIGDLDQDSIPDLVVTTEGDGSVWVLLGNGDATFETAGGYGVGGTAYSLAIGDLNGDSIPDLTTARGSWSGGSVSVLLGNGDGTFQEAIVDETIGSPTSVAIGDLDGDGIPDLATSNYFRAFNVSVLLGNGDGTFLPAIYSGTVGYAYSVAMGDLDSDGSQDLVVTNATHGYASIDFIEVLINERGPSATIFTRYSCEPTRGEVPIGTHMSVALLNRLPDQPRQVATRIQVDLQNGQPIANWKTGYQNIGDGGYTTTSWHQTIPALESLIGLNLFTLVAEDVTPAPWNQPPYAASGYQTEAGCYFRASSYTMRPLTKNGYPQ